MNGWRFFRGLTPLALVVMAMSSCTIKAPDLIDRHTMMEEEAAGDWPDFEKDVLKGTVEQGPTAFQTVPLSARQERLYNVLNAEPVLAPKTITK